jgi:elongation factor P
MINANSVRIGNIINFNKKLCVVNKLSHTQPGKGGAFVQMELKDILSNTKYNERFRSEDKIEKVFLGEVKLQFLYSDSDIHHFMNNETYEQISLSNDIISSQQEAFLAEGIILTGQCYEEKIISVMLDENLTAEIESTEATVKGQTAASSYKPAILTNGLRTTVPPFINNGDKIILKSADLTYIERVK